MTERESGPSTQHPRLGLRTAIGAYPHTQALKDGTVRASRLELTHVEISPISRAFRPMVNELAFDLSEMAIVTYILARAFGRRLVGLPIVLMRNSPHAAIIHNVRSGLRGPEDLAGRTIGVRAYTQTTGVWVRGVLQEQFGVELGKLRWITLENAHVDGYQDPPNVTRSDAGKSLLEMLVTGEIDAAVGIDGAGHPDLRPLIPDAERAEAEWSLRTGVSPINHIVVVKEEIAAAYPWVKGELFTLFEAAKQRSQVKLSFGLEQNRAAIEAIARYAFDQQITRRVLTPGELFEAT